MRPFGISLIFTVLLSALAKGFRLEVPGLQLLDWFDRPFKQDGWNYGLGDFLRFALLALGIWAVLKGSIQWNPLTVRKAKRFRSIGRGYWSAVILIGLAALASFDTLIVGKRALLVSHAGRLSVPFLQGPLKASDFGQAGEGEPDYRELKKAYALEGKGDWVILPPVPFAPKLDSDITRQALELHSDGKVYSPGSKRPFTGNAFTFHKGKPETKQHDIKFVQGLREGVSQVYDAQGNVVERIIYEKGQIRERKLLGESGSPASAEAPNPNLYRNLYPPTPPSLENRHFLGTDSGGNDVMAVLFGGFQLLIFASALYLLLTFSTGITLGCLMGFLGGKFDLVMQRLVEIWVCLPFLYVVIFLRSALEPHITLIIVLLSLFGWTSVSTYMRTAAYKEKARDYVAACRVLGASDWRIIFIHIVPNVISTLVTLVPFKIAGVIASISALDYLGFGLPPGEPSIGALLRDGSENMSHPWIIISATSAMVLILILVTFVGEAVREAFDPKKHTTYS